MILDHARLKNNRCIDILVTSQTSKSVFMHLQYVYSMYRCVSQKVRSP